MSGTDQDDRDASEESLTVTDRLAAGLDRFLARFEPLERRLDAAEKRSRVGAIERRVQSAVAGSWLWQWLTREPAGDPIVINLRETWTAGPVLSLAHRGLARAAPAFQARKESRASAALIWLAGRLPAIAGLCILGVVLWIVITWERLSPVAMVALAFATVAGAGFLTLVRTSLAVENSTAAGVAIALFAPPDPPRE